MEDMSSAYLTEPQERLRKGHEELLAKTLADLKESHPGLKTGTVLKEGSPARRIIETAAEEGVGLIVLGNRGSGGMAT